MAELVAAHAMVPTHLFTSPLVRAVQTAEVVAATLGFEGVVASHPPLVPGGACVSALSVLEECTPADRVLLVSHEPTVRALASHLAGFDFPAFPTSGIAAFERGDTRRFLGRFDPRLCAWRSADDHAS